MSDFELNQKIAGMDGNAFMAMLLEKNEKQEIEIERLHMANNILKQMNNRSRLLLDAEKFRWQMEQAQQNKKDHSCTDMDREATEKA